MPEVEKVNLDARIFSYKKELVGVSKFCGGPNSERCPDEFSIKFSSWRDPVVVERLLAGARPVAG
jgi:hypothetical protein